MEVIPELSTVNTALAAEAEAKFPEALMAVPARMVMLTVSLPVQLLISIVATLETMLETAATQLALPVRLS